MTSLATVDGLVGGASVLWVICMVILLVYCVFIKRKQDKNDNEMDSHSESEYFEAIDFSKIRREQKLTEKVTPLSLPEAHNPTISDKVESAQVQCGNDAIMTSYIRDSSIEYYNTAALKLHGSSKLCSPKQNDKKVTPYVCNTGVDKIILGVKNNQHHSMYNDRSTKYEQRAQNDWEPKSEFQEKDYFILEEVKTPTNGNDISPRNNNNQEMDTLRAVREKHLPVFPRKSNFYANQQDKNELNTDSVYFVLEK
ncbi:uncharacterized protein LOC111109998 [Crassostrea virginica]|nr:uncharacterized protein LOC111106459 isoform X2 [Crassostrea virginica]